MKMRHTLLLLATLAVLGCAKTEITEDSLAAEEQETAALAEEESCFQLGIANIYLSEKLTEAVELDLASEGGVVTRSTSEGLSSLYSSLGIVSMERLFPYAGEYEPRTRKEGLHRWYRVKFDPSVTLTRATADLSAVEGVEMVEEVPKLRLTAVFNDPYLSRQWHYYNDGSLSSNHKSGCDINVTPVWKNYTKGDRKVIVSVVDEGIDYSHEDLAWNYVGGYNFVTNTTVVTAGDHGSHTSGTIGAVNNNGIGVCGIAGGDYANGVQGVGLLSCQIFTDTSSGNSANAIKYGADNGAVISQNSWGYSYETENQARAGSINSSDRSAVDYFVKYAGCDNDGNQLADSPMKGGVVIFAAGNDGWAYGWPAEYDEIIAVGAIGPNFTASYYTNYGDWVDICAPGGDSRYSNGQVYSCEKNSTYAWMQGTSMACPHVSGVAALVVSYCGGPGFTAEALKEKLIGGSNTSVISSNSQIGGLVDALGAITYGSTIPPEKVTSYEVSPNSNMLEFTWNVTRDSDDVKAYGYTLCASTDKSQIENINFKNIPSGVSYTLVEVGDLAVGAEMTGILEVPEFETEYYVAISGYDYAGNNADLSEIKSVTTTANDPPTITTTYDGNYEARVFKALSINYTIEDPNGHGFTVSYTAGSVAETWTRNNANSYNFKVEGTATDPGSYTANVTVTDSYGASTSLDIPYSVVPNEPPVKLKDIDDMVFYTIGDRVTLDMDEYLYDYDGETLSWKIDNSNTSAVYVNIVGTTMTLTTLGYGSATVTITGTDVMSESVSTTFNVLVSDGKEAPTCYPNPVRDILYVTILSDTEATFTMWSSTGSKVYESTQQVSMFKDTEIDVSGFAPGRYTLDVSYNGVEYTLNVTKI